MKTECILVCNDVAKSIPVSGRLKQLPPTTIPFNENWVVHTPTDASTAITSHSKEHEKKTEHKWNPERIRPTCVAHPTPSETKQLNSLSYFQFVFGCKRT